MTSSKEEFQHKEHIYRFNHRLAECCKISVTYGPCRLDPGGLNIEEPLDGSTLEAFKGLVLRLKLSLP